jgi:hypothetical protein
MSNKEYMEFLYEKNGKKVKLRIDTSDMTAEEIVERIKKEVGGNNDD